MFVGFKLKLADGLIVQLLSVEIHVFFKKIKEDWKNVDGENCAPNFIDEIWTTCFSFHHSMYLWTQQVKKNCEKLGLRTSLASNFICFVFGKCWYLSWFPNSYKIANIWEYFHGFPLIYFHLMFVLDFCLCACWGSLLLSWDLAATVLYLSAEELHLFSILHANQFKLVTFGW